MVELEIVPSVCHETVRQTLRAKDLKPWLQRQWGIAPTASADFVCHMEDVLEVYNRPFDPLRPVVCLDETAQQLVSETRTPQPAAAGRPVRHDYEYERQGGPLCSGSAPCYRVGGRLVCGYAGRAWIMPNAYGRWRRSIFPKPRRLCWSKTISTPCRCFASTRPSSRGPRAACWSALNSTTPPKHGSWLNIAEIELSALSRQCLDRRIGDWNLLRQEVMARTARRYQPQCKINWRFTTAEARIKLKNLSPSFED